MFAVISGVVNVAEYVSGRTSVSNSFFDIRIVNFVSAGHEVSGVKVIVCGFFISKLPRIIGLIFIYFCKSFLFRFIANVGAYGPDSQS